MAAAARDVFDDQVRTRLREAEVASFSGRRGAFSWEGVKGGMRAEARTSNWRDR